MGKSASRCLDEHDVLAFATGQLEPHRRGHAVVHIDECDHCRALVAELARENVIENDEAAGEGTPSASLIDERFRLIAPLGSGAMGTVYRARDEKLGIDVALKLLRTTGEEVDPKAHAFARELTVGRRVTHPNVCRLHDAGRHEDAPYITMELVEGETLADLLQREEVSEERALAILRGVAEGLAAVHAAGIVHRDLKPANVMIARSTERPILTDFGFAAELDSKQSRRLVGTPSFWAPEQARGEPATPASDVYSLGLVAYRLLARREFSLSDRAALAVVPRAHRPFIAACLASRPTERPQNASAALELLRRKGRPPLWLLAPTAPLLLGIVWWLAHSSPPPATSGATPTEPAPASSLSADVRRPVEAVPATEPSSSATVTSASAASSGSAVPSAVPKPENSSRPVATRPAVVHRGGAGVAVSASASAPAPRPEPDPLYRH